MGNIAAVAITTASLFLLVVGVMLNSAALFYMSMALVGAIVSTRVQAIIASRFLRFERRAPQIVRVGDTVTIELLAMSERAIQRSLVMLQDHVPNRMRTSEMTRAVPVAPGFGEPVISTYSFRIERRGRYKWDTLTVIGVDSFGIARVPREYKTPPTELIVLPAPIPIDIEMPSATGWGFEETEHGLSRGQGLEPRGVREYSPGDAMRYIHWKSSAKAGKMLVKEFETGSQAAIAMIAQTTVGSEMGSDFTTLDHICGHMAYLIERFCRKNLEVYLPGLVETNQQQSAFGNEWDLQVALASLEADAKETLTEQLHAEVPRLPSGTAIYLFMTLAEANLPGYISTLCAIGHPVFVVVYRLQDPTRSKAARSGYAADKAYIDELSMAGAKTEIVELGVFA
ncbi:MAG: DUF58 domain-containing protein [Fimbriimonadaceae bacterium]|nr:DUF58 domain-containing protein [Fimbriimonadaceae bacterium]